MKILLVDDHPIFLEGLKNLLILRGLDVVGTARNGWEAIDQAGISAPDVILMDIIMPGCDGLTATRIIKARHPGIKVVMLTMSETDEDLFAAIKNGAFGYLLKTEDADRLLMLLEGLMRGEVPLSQGLAVRVLDEFAQRTPPSGSCAQGAHADSHLTSRQIQVLTLVAQGLTYKEIGTKLFLTERTIKYHMGEIIERLHLENRRQAIDYARGMKFI
ncbi:response regulator transcription factor [Desulfatirhabdium butyrativorans]|uniref:response regulator transcription factor n=1 Tax=Desulfatirhabdium butyrativorans TaxID=340467 RepID=UPI00040C1944|nr:response regulator transcription factor [Desulfatirhabdium butyrativorans]